MAVVKPVRGPACPKCGCQHSTQIGQWGRAERTKERRLCRYCGTRWQCDAEEADADPPVIFPQIRCPRCGSAETRVTSTRRPVRHHKCDACGKAFKSNEPRGAEDTR